MLAWMRSFGDLRRVGVERSGSYGAGLLRYLQAAGVEVLEVTAPDKLDRRRRGKTMTMMQQAQLTQPLRNGTQSHRAAAMEWPKVFGF